MGIFSIKDIEAVSGIRCHTLRVWEQRYGVIKPKRTESNIRYYDDDDLKYILNISILNKKGYKISNIARMPREDVHELILKLTGTDLAYDGRIKALISAMMLYDEDKFLEVLNENIRQEGMEQTMLRLVFPFLNEAGILWQIGSIHPAQEHFASNIMKQKLFVAIDQVMGYRVQGAKKFLLFLPQNEQHSLGLLLANYILRKAGQEIIFLGQEVPVIDLQKTAEECNPDYVCSVMTSACRQTDRQKFVNELSVMWPNATILLSGIQVFCCDLQWPANVKILQSMNAFIDFVKSIPNEQN